MWNELEGMSSAMANPRVFMIGWEYPPHNSGGLGVACEGMTHALADQQTQLYFTLPYQLIGGVSHMQVLTCTDPSWSADGQLYTPPFLSYSAQQPVPMVAPSTAVNSDELRALPQSELERKVDQYAHQVAQTGSQMKRGFDIIHAHDWMSFPAALALANRTRKPFIAHVHSTEFDRVPHGLGSSFITHTEAQGMQRADRVVAVSFYTKRLLVDRYGIDPEKIEVVHNGIAPALPAPNPGKHHFASKRPVIVFMGRLTMQKGAEYFLKLARSTLRAIPEALFVVAGNGDMYHQLLFQSAYDQLSASVLFSGFLREGQKDMLLDRADVFVMPSVSEPFGLVALEAAQRHTPVIISKNAGVSEVLKGSISRDFWDIDGMTREIVRLLTDAPYAQTVRDAQLSDVAATTWEASAQSLRGVYRKVMHGFTGLNR